MTINLSRDDTYHRAPAKSPRDEILCGGDWNSGVALIVIECGEKDVSSSRAWSGAAWFNHVINDA